MNRRESLKYLSVGCSLPILQPSVSYDLMTTLKAAHHYIYLDVHSSYPTALPSNFRAPFHWSYFGMGKDGKSLILSLKGTIDKSCKELRLRLTTALDSREEKQVEVSIPEYNIVLGVLDCKYSPLLQITELAIEKKYLALVQENGLRLKSTLPFAVLARLYPEHPILKKVEKFWTDRLNSLGAIVDYSLTAEGAYTIAYPMAVLAQAWERQDLAKMALQQLRIRGKLVYEGANYLRYYPDTQKRTYKNWARGIA
jgi:hypothetical protein